MFFIAGSNCYLREYCVEYFVSLYTCCSVCSLCFRRLLMPPSSSRSSDACATTISGGESSRKAEEESFHGDPDSDAEDEICVDDDDRPEPTGPAPVPLPDTQAHSRPSSPYQPLHSPPSVGGTWLTCKWSPILFIKIEYEKSVTITQFGWSGPTMAGKLYLKSLSHQTPCILRYGNEFAAN